MPDQEDEQAEIENGPDDASESGGYQRPWSLHERRKEQPACQAARSAIPSGRDGPMVKS